MSVRYDSEELLFSGRRCVRDVQRDVSLSGDMRCWNLRLVSYSAQSSIAKATATALQVPEPVCVASNRRLARRVDS
jgi:hypothetical protein